MEWMFLGDGAAQWIVATCAIFGLILSGWAVWLVKTTLDVTRATLKEANAATKAAVQNVDITVELGQIQTRAYLAVTEAILVHNEYGYSVDLTIRNVGNSPAFDVRAVFSASSETITGHPDENLSKVHEHPLVAMIGAGVDERCSFGISSRCIVDALGKPTPDGRVMMVELIVRYQTVFDKKNGTHDLETGFRLLDLSEPGVRRRPKDADFAKRTLHISSILMKGWMDTYRQRASTLKPPHSP
jgi:hypothetical protein